MCVCKAFMCRKEGNSFICHTHGLLLMITLNEIIQEKKVISYDLIYTRILKNKTQRSRVQWWSLRRKDQRERSCVGQGYRISDRR